MNYMTPIATLVNTNIEEASCSACATVIAGGQTITVEWNGGCPTTALLALVGGD